MKCFASEEAILREFGVVQTSVKSKTGGLNIYNEALSVPYLCSLKHDQCLEKLSSTKYSYLKDHDLAVFYISEYSEKSIKIFITKFLL